MVRGKVRDPFLEFFPTVSGSNSDPTSESWSDSGLPPELKSDGINFYLILSFIFSHLIFVPYFAAMSRRISLKKLGEKVEKAKGESSAKKSIPVKGVVIGEKRSRDDPSISPSKKAKPGDSPKGKEPVVAPEPRKK